MMIVAPEMKIHGAARGLPMNSITDLTRPRGTPAATLLYVSLETVIGTSLHTAHFLSPVLSQNADPDIFSAGAFRPTASCVAVDIGSVWC
jgi:hypothetical protein